MSDGEREQNGSSHGQPVAATTEQQREQPPSVVISDGAALALGNVLSRFLTTTDSGKRAKVGTKRPRSSLTADHHHQPLVLADNEDVQKEVDEERAQRKRLKEHRKQKLAFERNGRVIPDAATGVKLERELLATATKGAVALFNAITKAQKAADKARRDAYKEKKKLAKGKDKDKDKNGNTVSKQGFMNLMKAGMDKTNSKNGTVKAGPLNNMDEPSENDDDNNNNEKARKKKKSVDSDDESDSESRSEQNESASESESENDRKKKKKTVANAQKGPKPKWLKDDYLTSGAKRLRDWDKTETHSQESSEDSSEDETTNQSSDGAGKDEEDEQGLLDISGSDEDSDEESEA